MNVLNSNSKPSKSHRYRPNSTSLDTLPCIILPFPPNITAYEIAHKRLRSKICSRPPNAFFIYRKVFVDHLLFLDHKLKMTDVSRLVSKHWKNESQEVRAVYEKISNQVEKELNVIRNNNLVYADDIEKDKVVKRRRQRTDVTNERSTVRIENSTNEASLNPFYRQRFNLNYLQPTNFNLNFNNNSAMYYDNELTMSPIDLGAIYDEICSQSINNYPRGFNDQDESCYNNNNNEIVESSQDSFEGNNLNWYLGELNH